MGISAIPDALKWGTGEVKEAEMISVVGGLTLGRRRGGWHNSSFFIYIEISFNHVAWKSINSPS